MLACGWGTASLWAATPGVERPHRLGSPVDGAPMQRRFMSKSGWTLVIGGSLGLVLALLLGSGSLHSVSLPGRLISQ